MFNAKPWEVTQRLTWTPMAAIFFPSTQTPTALGSAAGGDAVFLQCAGDGFDKGVHVGADVALPLAQIEDGVADKLAGAVIGDVATAVGFVNVDAASGEHFRAGEDVAEMGVAAERDDVRMFDEQQLVGDESGLAPGLEMLLELKCLGPAETPQITGFAGPRHQTLIAWP